MHPFLSVPARTYEYRPAASHVRGRLAAGQPAPHPSDDSVRSPSAWPVVLADKPRSPSMVVLLAIGWPAECARARCAWSRTKTTKATTVLIGPVS
jgi:hypothetical protein